MLRIIVLSVCVSTLLGCSVQRQLETDDRLTIQDVYAGVERDEDYRQRFHLPLEGNTDLRAYTRSPMNELDDLFPELPNPVIQIYVTPHLSQGGLPVPGYSTKIRMYKKHHYALPGEVGRVVN